MNNFFHQISIAECPTVTWGSTDPEIAAAEGSDYPTWNGKWKTAEEQQFATLLQENMGFPIHIENLVLLDNSDADRVIMTADTQSFKTFGTCLNDKRSNQPKDRATPADDGSVASVASAMTGEPTGDALAL